MRPEDMRVGDAGDWTGTVLSVQRSGARARLRARLRTAAVDVEVELPPDAPAYAAGQVVALAARRHGVFAAAVAG